MSDERALCEKIRTLIETGSLPNRKADAMWGGPGSGGICPVCGEVVTAADVEMELEFSGHAGGPVDRYHLHSRCFAGWEFERHNLEVARKRGVSADETNGSTGSSQAATPL
jgi:hypothetical protein